MGMRKGLVENVPFMRLLRQEIKVAKQLGHLTIFLKLQLNWNQVELVTPFWFSTFFI